MKSKAEEIVSFDEFMIVLGIELNIDKITSENKIVQPLHKVQYKDKFIKIHLAILQMKIMRLMVLLQLYRI